MKLHLGDIGGAIVTTSVFSLIPNWHSASAAPTENRSIRDLRPSISKSAGITFRVDQIPNQHFNSTRKGRGAIAKASAYSKYGAPVPQDLRAYIEQTISTVGTGNKTMVSPQGGVTATPQISDSEYLCPVQIGTPPQTLNLDFDTASSDFWVFSSETPTDQIDGQTIYDISQSSTAIPLNGESWAVNYGDGSSSGGNVYNDIVSIGGIAVPNQAVEAATYVSPSLTWRQNSDGIVGLAFSSLNTVTPNREPTFFDNALQYLAEPLFTANLRPAAPGNYNFGFINTTEFIGEITYIPVNTTTGFWQFTSQGFKIGDSPLTTQPHDAVADTGTTLLLLPDPIAAAYYAQIPNSAQGPGGYVFPCEAIPPNYTAVIGPYEAVVPGDSIKFSPVDGDSFDNATTCFGGIQSAPADSAFAIYGDLFLKSQFVVFHAGGDVQLGLARKAP
ncbi:eukaryotic aspartyl protease [Xylaria sp. CBS 124048]|nr:eukaryotic aspartyl protease [Xylaria sp. CBS 124048]